MSLKSLTAGVALAITATTAQAFDSDAYRALVAQTVEAIFSGDVDVVELTGLQRDLVDLGVEGVQGFAAENAEHATMMNFIAEQAPMMSQMSLADIETAWHDGEALRTIGIDFHDLNHFGPEISHMDAVVHPATAIIALREYEATGDSQYLDQVVDELSEVVEHLAYLE